MIILNVQDTEVIILSRRDDALYRVSPEIVLGVPGCVGWSVVDEDVGEALPPQRPGAPVRQPRRLVQQHLAGLQTNLDISLCRLIGSNVREAS